MIHLPLCALRADMKKVPEQKPPKSTTHSRNLSNFPGFFIITRVELPYMAPARQSVHRLEMWKKTHCSLRSY